MDKEKLIADIKDRILFGIDKTETENLFGWWETSTGAEFGEKKLAAVIKAIENA